MRDWSFRVRSARALALAAAGLCGTAVSTPSALAVGPDVIVGDIPDVVNNLGTSGGRRVYAFGTTSCNLGDAPLTWLRNTNVHPVISQNMYRLANGRFEQVGQAWLKHGFCALQGTVCSTCAPGGDCDALFPGCSDPYSASLNSEQGGLGPKSEVNAATGAFLYPWVNRGVATTAAGKRLAVLTTDLDAGLAAGGLFFFASMYVQPEDSSAGNDTNNSSYRRVTVSAAPNYTVGLVDTTQRGRAAIYAWKDHGLGAGAPDPDVVITPVDIAGDGRFLVGAKATNLGGGQWHYEYAIENINSDRSGQSFTVPLPAGAVVTNIGFHDVEYTSGEPYDGSDWSSAVSPSAITWSTVQSFAQNANANALRWDTIYNFRFDCNIPPAGGMATLGMFKSGAPVSMSTVVPASDGVFHPLNDNCANAAAIGAGTAGFSNVSATTDGPDEPTGCTFSGYSQVGSDIWYRYTSNSCATGNTTITTCGSEFDTKIAVYSGSCPTASGTVIVCNDDVATCAVGTLQSAVSFVAIPNTQYLIRVGGYNALTGAGTLSITAPSCGPVAPANDNCAAAEWLTHNVPATGTNVLATNDGTANCGDSASSPDVWFKYRPATNATANFNTCGTNTSFDTVLSLFTGSCGGLTQVACNDDNNGTGGNNACGGGLNSGLNYSVVAGTTYHVRVAGYSGDTGPFTVRVIGGDGVAPPANDLCSARPGIGLGATEFSNLGAGTDGPAHAMCLANASNQITGDLWWNFPSTFAGRLKIETCAGAGFDSRIAVYTGNGCSDFESRLVACTDDGPCTAGRAQAIVNVVSGQNYTIRVGGFNGAAGAGTLTLSQIPCAPDIDGVPGVAIDDIFAYLNAWFAGCTGQGGSPCNGVNADFDGVGGVAIDDIFAYLNAWFAGC